MYAPLPESMLVVVQPPKFFVECGLAQPGELWTLHRAVYGLKAAPRAWGLERDSKFRNMSWTANGKEFFLQQCESDSQVWMIRQRGSKTNGEFGNPGGSGTWEANSLTGPRGDANSQNHLLRGLVVVYVDDFLILSPDGAIRNNLISTMKQLWKMKDEVVLSEDSELTFLRLPRITGIATRRQY